MRDKAGKALFDATDLPKARKIADRIGEQFVNKNVFGQQFITLSEAPERPLVIGTNVPVTEARVAGPATAAQAPSKAKASLWPAERPPATNVPRLATLIIEARSNAERIAVPESPESIGETELAAIRDMLRTMLQIPGAAVASVSAYGHMGGVQEVAARSTLTEEAMNVLQSKLNLWLTKRGEAGGFVRKDITLSLREHEAPHTGAPIQKVFTAPVAAGVLQRIYLTAVVSVAPASSA